MTPLYLIIEFLDELVFGVGEVDWPLLRDDLNLTYTQIGLLLSLPGIMIIHRIIKDQGRC